MRNDNAAQNHVVAIGKSVNVKAIAKPDVWAGEIILRAEMPSGRVHVLRGRQFRVS